VSGHIELQIAGRIDHYRDAERALERADYIANADNWHGDRPLDVSNKLAEAQVHATLALRDATLDASHSIAKSNYDGRP
jgi:hypothetical protein